MSLFRLALFAALVQAVLGGTAHGQDWEAGAVGEASAGYNDNVLAAGDDEGPIEDFFYQLRPSAVTRYESPRHRYDASYTFGYLFYQENSEANATSHALSSAWRWLASSRSVVLFDVNLDMGTTNGFAIDQRPEGGTVDLQPGGRTTFRRARAGQRYRWQASERLDVTQELSASWALTRPEDDAELRGTEAGFSIGADRRARDSSYGGSLGLSLIDLRRDTATDASLTRPYVDALARYRRELSTHWTGSAAAGVRVALDSELSAREAMQPTGLLEAAYLRDPGGVILSYRRSAAAELFVAQTSEADELAVRAWLPLVDGAVPAWTLAGSAAARRTRVLESGGASDGATFRSYLADVAVAWAPERSRFGVTVRYQHRRQRAVAGAFPAADDYAQNSIMVVVGARFLVQREPPQLPSMAREAADGLSGDTEQRR